MKDRLKRFLRRLLRKPVCEHKGCGNTPELYELGFDEETSEPIWICFEHAPEAGFCRTCGGFFAGCWEFDLSRSGLCHDCQRQMEHDLGCDDEWELEP